MDLISRIYSLHRELRNRRYPVSCSELQEKLECSRATVKRIIQKMRLYFNAPIEYERKPPGYIYKDNGQRFELPGIWFNPSELLTLFTIQHLLSGIQPGLLKEYISPLSERIEKILLAKKIPLKDAMRRIRILPMTCRRVEPQYLKRVASAVIERKKLAITYHSRTTDSETERTLSPQRIVYYRDNWYLDAWDHTKKALRTFALDRVKTATVLKQRARDIPEQKLNDYFATAFGIFAGRPKHRAVLRFSPERSRWVADESWHPEQKGGFQENGYYLLEFPYSDHRELVMDILKHGPEVEVISPPALRREVIRLLRQALAVQQRLEGETKKGASFKKGEKKYERLTF